MPGAATRKRQRNAPRPLIAGEYERSSLFWFLFWLPRYWGREVLSDTAVSDMAADYRGFHCRHVGPALQNSKVGTVTGDDPAPVLFQKDTVSRTFGVGPQGITR